MTALLAREHRAVDELFTLLERAKGTPGRRRGLATLHDALAAHATSEESLLYRALRASLSPEGHRSVSLAHEEHHRIKDWLAQLGATSPAAPAFADLVVRLKAAVRIHVREEEQVLFPLARRVLGIPVCGPWVRAWSPRARPARAASRRRTIRRIRIRRGRPVAEPGRSPSLSWIFRSCTASKSSSPPQSMEFIMRDNTYPDRTYPREALDGRLGILDLNTRPVARAGGIVAGVFTVLATLVLLGEIGMAAGMSAYDAGDRAAAYALGAGIWGLVSAILAFLVGGYVAARLGRPAPGRDAATHGGLVWAVAVPVIGFVAAILAIGTVTAAGVTTIAAVQADPTAAAEAAATVRARTGEPVLPAGTVRRELDPRVGASGKLESAAKAAGAVGFGAVAALVLALAAAVVGGSLGAKPYKSVTPSPDVDTVPPSLREGSVPYVRATTGPTADRENSFPRL